MLKDKKQFEEKIRSIFHYLLEYGIARKQIDLTKPVSPADRMEFIIAVHEGYRIGQQLILEEMLVLLKEQEILALDLKEKGKDKGIKEVIQLLQKEVGHRILILRNLVDHMAWMIFHNQYYIARRFYSGSRSRPSLLSANLQSVLPVVEDFHRQDPRNFCLLSDLTSFIDIGDLILVDGDNYNVIECKSGEVQKKVFDFIDEMAKDDFSPETLDYTGVTDKFFDQLERSLRQMERSAKLGNFLREEKGPDPFKKVNVSVIENDKPNQYYFDTIRKLIQDTLPKNMAQAVVEDTIFLVAFSGEAVLIADQIVQEMVDTMNPNLYVREYSHLLTVPLKESLFMKPIGKEYLIDLLFKRLRIYMALDFERLFKQFAEKGITAAWATRKQTAKYLENATYRPFVRNNQAITLSANDRTLILGDTFIVQLLFDNLLPSSLVDRYVFQLNTPDLPPDK